jgi:hypothetical protein
MEKNNYWGFGRSFARRVVAEFRVCSQSGPYEIFGGQSGSGTGFSIVFWVFHSMFYSTVVHFILNNQTDALIIQIYSVIKLYMFRASSLPIIRSLLLYIRHW